jgi:hypothetical protein
MTEPSLTPAQQALMGFLERLASTDHVSPDLLKEGYQKLDQAVEERRRLDDSITDASKAISRSTPNQ